jgi:hypothetical protein
MARKSKKTTNSQQTSRKNSGDPNLTPTLDLRQFAADFFALFGAEVQPLDQHSHGPLRVVLPADLVDHFGKPVLGLSFQSVEDGSGHDLVAHGSRMFDRMLSLLDRRANLTVLRLPVRVQGSETLLSAVRPLNAGITNLRMQDQMQSLFAFDWRITYRADDKREELYTVVMDESGARLPQPGEANASPEAVDIAALLADGETPPIEFDQDGAPLPAKLPPLAQLVRFAESARKFVVYHADLRCVAHEAEILPRLYKVLDRLTTYYTQQIEELQEARDSTGEKRQGLEADLARKSAEEVDNHRLRVNLELISYAVLWVPVAVADLTIGDGQRDAPLRVRLNRYNGALRRSACHACGQEVSAVALCRNGHIMCDGCLRQCDHCRDVLCAECGVEICPVCGAKNCERCGRTCWACGERACAEHLSRCPTCGDEVCHACQTECAHCGVRQCRNHLRADCVVGTDGQTQLICASCAVRCPACQQYSAQIDLCSASGQRFCANCIAVCTDCGRKFGPGFYVRTGPDQAPYCRSCIVECPHCRQAADEVLACRRCGGFGCVSCGDRCAICKEFFCQGHVQRFTTCGHAICADHVERCAVGKEAVCPLCSEPCGICERAYCDNHKTKCAWCGVRYCSECVRQSTRLCDTCSAVARSEETIDLLEEPCAISADARALAPRYSWRRASNIAVTVYFGVGAGGCVLVVAQRKPDGSLRVYTRRLTNYDLMLTTVNHR